MSSPRSSRLPADKGKTTAVSSQNASAGRVVIVTGLSGAGKSTALKALEDLGFYCIDNLPVFLLSPLLKEAGRRERGGRFAIGMDARSDNFLDSFPRIYAKLSKQHSAELLFLEADEEVLIRRYSEVRRKHPLASPEGLQGAIARERTQLEGVRAAARQVVDTSRLTIHELRKRVWTLYREEGAGQDFAVTLLSFGFKHGLPLEADLVFDARFLPNPYFVPALKALTGLEPEVAAYALNNDLGREFLDRLQALLTFLIPQYRREGKMGLTVAIGCTGGRHRSVAVTQELCRRLSPAGVTVTPLHRDAGRV